MKFPGDRKHVRRHPQSQPIRVGVADGGYVYVQDEFGTIWALRDGPHRHPRVLGENRPAKYAGDLVIENGRIKDLTNLSGTFQFDDPDGLLAVADELEHVGFVLDSRGVRFFQHHGRITPMLR